MHTIDKKIILRELRKHKALLKRKYGISRVGIFGSVARGTAKETSDVDIVIELKEADPFILLDIKEELGKLFGCKVDIVRLRKNMNKFLKERIDREAIYV